MTTYTEIADEYPMEEITATIAGIHWTQAIHRPRLCDGTT